MAAVGCGVGRGRRVILVDPPNAAGHGRLWSHLASDSSYAELHDFAARLGVPTRGFDRDHYDVPAEWYDATVAAGAVPVTSRELIVRLRAAGLRRRKSESLRPRHPGRPLLRPPLLRPGSVVAVVSPAGPADPATVDAGVAQLRGWELEVRPPPAAARGGLPWLAGSDDERAAALTEAWLADDVDVVWCIRGGFGSARVVQLLDWRLLATGRPKTLVGFSDVTALHQAFAARLGVSTVHGPVLTSIADSDEATRESLRSLLVDGVTEPLEGMAGSSGTAGGTLVGGTLRALAAASGTGASHAAADSIAVLEDVGEVAHRLDRSLTQLLQVGWFDGVRGVVCGRFRDCGDPDLVRGLLAERLEPLAVPVLYEVPVGHGPANTAFPLGVRARLEVGRDRGSLSVDAHPGRRARA